MEKFWVAIEGCDMTGKATQSEALRRELLMRGIPAVVVEVPWERTFTYRVIYSMLESGSAKRWPRLFQLIHMLNKLSCQIAIMTTMPDCVVIFDRWHLSSVVYGQASGLSKSFCEWLGSLLIKPDVTVVLSRDSQHQRDESRDAYESDERLQRRASQLYREACDGISVISVDANGSVEQVSERVRQAISIAARKRNIRL